MIWRITTTIQSQYFHRPTIHDRYSREKRLWERLYNIVWCSSKIFVQFRSGLVDFERTLRTTFFFGLPKFIQRKRKNNHLIAAYQRKCVPEIPIRFPIILHRKRGDSNWKLPFRKIISVISYSWVCFGDSDHIWLAICSSLRIHCYCFVVFFKCLIKSLDDVVILNKKSVLGFVFFDLKKTSS